MRLLVTTVICIVSVIVFAGGVTVAM